MKRSFLKSLTLLACFAAVPLVAGCGKSATAPQAAPEPPPATVMHTDIRFDYIAVVQDGDLIGDGDFEFRRGVNGTNTLTARTMRTGDVWTLDKTQTVTGEGSRISVYFEASEWDEDLLGQDFRDSDMDKFSATHTHTVSAGLGGQRAITLGGGSCEVKLYYSLITYYTVE